eukprot:CAMPEP_0117654406 /NCGR_PEP_ID=MMETSP0804-20121206/3727_1 /TAXON_ID=1074897 /ORGANISM="Tetraselmis astigmatica, Strain CCMP880" /LENGTH=87 /DNA_ID=CAMNT_0005460685 /DNA_START=513 /DNA_END=776 /DNA_ORIENTATION=+
MGQQHAQPRWDNGQGAPALYHRFLLRKWLTGEVEGRRGRWMSAPSTTLPFPLPPLSSSCLLVSSLPIPSHPSPLHVGTLAGQPAPPA